MSDELKIGSSEDMLANATKIEEENKKEESDDKMWGILLTMLAFGGFGSKNDNFRLDIIEKRLLALETKIDMLEKITLK